MNFYYINTDANTLGYSPHAKWIKYEYAFTSGDDTQEGYEKSGVDKLGNLEPGDILFMYVSGAVGIVAAGRVTDCWQGSSYKGNDRLVYQDTDCTEYRIPVDWCLPIVSNPVTLDEFREVMEWKPTSAPPGTLGAIDEDKGRKLLNEVQSWVSQC